VDHLVPAGSEKLEEGSAKLVRRPVHVLLSSFSSISRRCWGCSPDKALLSTSQRRVNGMRDVVASYLMGEDLGWAERRVALRGGLTLGGRRRAETELVLTEKGAFLIAAGESNGVAIDLLERPDVRYEPGRLSDTLRVGDVELGVPPGKGDEALRIVALARLRRHAVQGLRTRPARHVQGPDEIERALLAVHLQPEELLLGWLETATHVPVVSTILNDAEGTLRLLLTDRRVELVTTSAAGDVWSVALDAPLQVDMPAGGIGRASVSSGSRTWHSTRQNARLFCELVPASGLPGKQRLLEVARLNWIAGEERSFARHLVEVAAQRGDALATLLAFLIWAELEEPDGLRPDLEGALRALGSPEPRTIADLWQSFQFEARAAARLIEALRDTQARAEPWAFELHERLHAAISTRAGDPIERANAALSLAEHALDAQKNIRAQALLEALLAELPSEALEDLLPPRDADLTAGAGGQALRVRSLELLSRARGGLSGDRRAITELARLQPLVTKRLEDLRDASDGDLRRRAQRVLDVLSPGGLADDEQQSVQALPPATLSAESLERTLQHPLAREGALLGRLQTLLALVPVPDHGILRDYCERVSSSRHGEVARALADGARALGVEGVQAYVSRGDKAVGFRAYENAPHFVLVGGEHLEQSSPYHMVPGELCFALGAELAHLRYGHSRVTSSEVWAGALSKTRDGLDLALGVLPLLKGWKIADRLSRVFSRIPTDAVKKALRGARAVTTFRPDREHPVRDRVLSALNEELVAAHRVMQLTADRAGLVLCGDPAAALRAMLLGRPDYREALPRVEHEGIGLLLAERDAEGRIRFQDLAVRTAALLSFYLSDEYVRLRDELLSSSGSP
jgi:hypothetical protein